MRVNTVVMQTHMYIYLLAVYCVFIWSLFVANAMRLQQLLEESPFLFIYFKLLTIRIIIDSNYFKTNANYLKNKLNKKKKKLF